jgi:hypothetical protein
LSYDPEYLWVIGMSSVVIVSCLYLNVILEDSLDVLPEVCDILY